MQPNIILHEEYIENPTSIDTPHTFPGKALGSYSIDRFREKCKVKIWRIVKGEEMEFDLIGVDASIANAIRRTMIAEVPTMAIEKVFIFNNTSVVMDEILSNRVGLVPIKADPTLFDFIDKDNDDQATDRNTIVFRLTVKCELNPNADAKETEVTKKYTNTSVYSGDLEWIPQGEQKERFEKDPIRAVYSDILLAKLRYGQEITLELHCEKGRGKEHAKWSPVGTASYRLLPHIVIKQDIVGEDAEKFAKCFPSGVVKIVNENGKKVAKVVNPRKCTMSRECLRHKEFADKVRLERIRDHFIYNVESTGAIPPEEIVLQAIQLIKDKCVLIKGCFLANSNVSVDE